MREELKLELLQIARALPLDDLPRFLGDIEEIRVTAESRLFVGVRPMLDGPEELLAIDAASSRLGVSKDYLYRHQRDFPFVRKIGSRVLFSSHGIDVYIRQHAGLTAGQLGATVMPLTKNRRRRYG